ncbi:helix-hairpin-helix domain-containing protein [Streptomyces sp. NPDC058657]|uniref:ComEA family DNA-binding protein n=1 Tax=unclassified Streptomyces TaxID=2593676 RepID=UPI0036569456
MEPRTVGALAAVLVVSAGFAFHHFWSGRPEPVRAPATVEAGGTAPRAAVPRTQPSPSVPPAAGTLPARVPALQAPGSAVVVVDVSGGVRRPGVHQLPAGSRVADALRMAGGVKAGQDLGGLNRARVLTDGEQVVVGGPAPPVPGAGAPGAGPGSGSPAVPVSLNTATVEQLDTLPGVGPVLARHIVDYRTQHGGFRSVEELREVDGIGDRRFTDLQPLVRP